MYFIVIRPKQKEIPCYFITKLLSDISNKRDLILKILGKPSNYQFNSHILFLFISQEFITFEPYLFEYYEKELKSRMEGEEEALKRTVCDYIAGMTDRYAIQKYKEIFIPQSIQNTHSDEFLFTLAELNGLVPYRG